MTRGWGLLVAAAATGALGGGNPAGWAAVAADGLLLPVLAGVAGIACLLVALPMLALAAAGAVQERGRAPRWHATGRWWDSDEGRMIALRCILGRGR